MSSTSQWTTWKSNGLFHLLIQDVSSVSGPSTWPGNKLRILWLPSAKRVSPQNASLSLCILNQLIHIYYKLWKLMSDVLQGWRQFSSFQFISIPTYSCRGGSSDISQHALGKSRDSLHTLPSWFGAKFTYLHRWTIQRTACLFTVKWNYRAWRKPQRWGENTSSLLIERTKVMSCTCRRSPFIEHNATFEFE